MNFNKYNDPVDTVLAMMEKKIVYDYNRKIWHKTQEEKIAKRSRTGAWLEFDLKKVRAEIAFNAYYSTQFDKLMEFDTYLSLSANQNTFYIYDIEENRFFFDGLLIHPPIKNKS